MPWKNVLSQQISSLIKMSYRIATDGISKKATWTWKMSFEQQIPESDRNVRLYSNRGEVVVRGERRGERLADQTGKVSTWLIGRL